MEEDESKYTYKVVLIKKGDLESDYWKAIVTNGTNFDGYTFHITEIWLDWYLIIKRDLMYDNGEISAESECWKFYYIYSQLVMKTGSC